MDYIFGPFRQFLIIPEPLCGALTLTCQGPFQSEMSKLSAVLWMWPRPCGVLRDLFPLLHETSPIFFSFDKSSITQEAYIKTIRGHQQTPTEATSSKEVLNLMLSQVKRLGQNPRCEVRVLWVLRLGRIIRSWDHSLSPWPQGFLSLILSDGLLGSPSSLDNMAFPCHCNWLVALQWATKPT